MSKMAKATLALMIVTMLSKFLGFGRELVLAAFYGTGTYSQAYISAMSIPSTLFTIIATAIVTTFIPLYFENYSLGNDEQANKFTSNILNIVVVIGIVIGILGMVFTDELVKIFAMGYEGEKFALTVKFTRIMIFGGLFIVLSRIMASFLQAKESFAISGMSGIPFNIIIITSIILSVKVNIYILPIGTLLAMASQFIFQYVFARKKGYKYKFVLDIKDEHVKKMIWLLGPVIIGVCFNQLNTVIDRTLATNIGGGSAVSVLNYANKLNGFVMGLFIASIAAVVYPILSNCLSSDDKEGFSKSIVKSVNSAILLVVPVSVGAIVLSKPIVSLLFERGAFDEKDTYMTAIALIFYSLGMVAFGLRDILVKVFYSLQDTKTPMVNGIISVIINIILNLVLSQFMGYAGLAFATSISSTVCIFLLFNSLKKKIGYFGQDKIIKATIKSLIAAIVMGIITYFVYEIMIGMLGVGSISEAISLFLSIGLGAIVYGILVILFKIEEVDVITKMIKNKMKKVNR